MRRVVVSAFMTLDGVVQAPGAPEEDPSGGFAHGGWSVHYWDGVMGEAMGEAMAAPFDLLLGRRTYEIFAAHWPYAGDDPTARKLNAATKHVASTTFGRLEWENSRLIEGDVAAAVARLKTGGGPELQVHGSGALVQTLLAAALVDEFRLWTFPLVLGAGKRLFGSGTVPVDLRLIASRTSTTGVVIGAYRPSGPVRTGSFALEKPTEAEVARRERLAREGGRRLDPREDQA